MTPTPPPASSAAKTVSPATRGCIIALLVVGVLGLVCVVGSAIVGVRAASSEQGKKVLGAMSKGMSLVNKGINAPGIPEVRAAGCPEAMALDLHEMSEIIDSFVDGGLKEGPEGVMVLCQGLGELPDCGTLAQAYASAKGRPPGDFMVTVKTKHQKKELCARRYSEDGEDLGALSR